MPSFAVHGRLVADQHNEDRREQTEGGQGRQLPGQWQQRDEHNQYCASLRLRGTDDPTNPEIAAFLDRLREALGEEALSAGVAAGRELERDAALARLDPVLLDAPAVRA